MASSKITLGVAVLVGWALPLLASGSGVGAGGGTDLTCGVLKEHYGKSACCGAAVSKIASENPCQSAQSKCQCLGDTLDEISTDFSLALFSTVANKSIRSAWASYMSPRNFPSAYGLSCAAHDDGSAGMGCQAGGQNENETWCKQPWCYMTQISCPDTHGTSAFANTSLEPFLFYSYGHCNGTDSFTGSSRRLEGEDDAAVAGAGAGIGHEGGEKEEVELVGGVDRRLQGENDLSCGALKNAYEESHCCGQSESKKAVVSPCRNVQPECRCLGSRLEAEKNDFGFALFGGLLGTNYEAAWQNYMVAKGYTSDYGLACKAHDSSTSGCLPGGANENETWCQESWCYMSSPHCNDTNPTSFFDGTAAEPYLHYSYAQCNGTDSFTTRRRLTGDDVCTSLCTGGSSSTTSTQKNTVSAAAGQAACVAVMGVVGLALAVSWSF